MPKMKSNTARVIGLLLPLCAASPAVPFVHAGGGSGYGSASAGHYGNTSYASASSTRTGAYGGTMTRSASGAATRNPNGTTSYAGSQHATYTAPDGQSVSGSKSTSGTSYNGYGTSHTTYGTSSGTTAYHSNYYGTTVYPGYHPPTTVNYYGSSCYNCGGWSAAGAAATGLAVGAVVGAAVASSNTAAATSNAYAAGVVAGANAVYAVGAIYPTLPAGSVVTTVQGQNYYLSGNTWFYPSYGANGVYYRVVPAP